MSRVACLRRNCRGSDRLAGNFLSCHISLLVSETLLSEAAAPGPSAHRRCMGGRNNRDWKLQGNIADLHNMCGRVYRKL
jgi:hypothetical protein